MPSSHDAPPVTLDCPLEVGPDDWRAPGFYQLLTALVVPRPIGWISTISESGVRNVAPYSYFNLMGSDPPYIAFGPTGIKDSLRNLCEVPEFVANIVTMHLLERMNLPSSGFPHEEDEFDWACLTPAPSAKVRPFRVAQAKAHLECEVAQIVTDRHTNIVLGRIVHAHVDPSVWKNGRVDPKLLDPVCRLSGSGYARRAIIAVVGARLDTKLNLHLFSRLLRLPLDYFERHPAGETMYQVAQVYRVREFLTGQLLATFLDLLTLAVLLPFLFWLNAPLAWVVLLCAAVISVIILAYLKPMREMYSRVVGAETWKAATLGETIVGIKTVKALALEPQRRAQWEERVAETGKWRLAFARLSNWPQTLVTPLERFMTMGTLMLGAYWAMDDSSGYMVGGLFAFMMLSGRVAQPLVGLARLVQEYEEVNAAIGEAGAVLNRPLEIDAASGGVRPKFAGAISFQDVTFTYGGTKIPAQIGR